MIIEVNRHLLQLGHLILETLDSVRSHTHGMSI